MRQKALETRFPSMGPSLRKQPMFCMETALKMLLWSYCAYTITPADEPGNTDLPSGDKLSGAEKRIHSFPEDSLAPHKGAGLREPGSVGDEVRDTQTKSPAVCELGKSTRANGVSGDLGFRVERGTGAEEASGDPEDPLTSAEADQLRATLKQLREAPVARPKEEAGQQAVVAKVGRERSILKYCPSLLWKPARLRNIIITPLPVLIVGWI